MPRRKSGIAPAAGHPAVAVRRSSRISKPPQRYTPPPAPTKVTKRKGKGKVPAAVAAKVCISTRVYTPLVDLFLQTAKKALASKASGTTKANNAKAAVGKKRKNDDEDDAQPSKKSKTNTGLAAPAKGRKLAAVKAPSAKAAAPVKVCEPLIHILPLLNIVQGRKMAKATKPSTKAAPKPKKELPIINAVATQKLEVFSMGEGSGGELGLGAKHVRGRMITDVKRPRLNPFLAADAVGVVALAVGGMHCAALTHDHRILTWGVNDGGALGRDSTTTEVKLKDADADDGSDSDSDFDEESGLNPNEASPGEVDLKHFPEGTKFASIYAGDSMTFVVTTTGLVYGWGSFRGNDGPIGFTPEVKMATRPILIPQLKNIVSMATGTNHVLALDNKGACWVWGAGEQNQLGRRVVARTAVNSLVPRPLPLPRGKHVIKAIGSGDYHAFAVTEKGDTFAWGLNSFRQTGIQTDDLDNTIIGVPTLVTTLRGKHLAQITGGAHSSIGVTTTGEVVVFGRLENSEGGIDRTTVDESQVFFQDGRPKFAKVPLVVPGIDATMVAAANDTCMAVTKDGRAFSWGANMTYQAGQGDIEDVKVATPLENSAIRGKQMVFCGIGGQFSLLGGLAAEREENAA
ncbi:hypothetical protein HYFRA_00010163 [Hymenoscyphus fraxineus]|uniref:RCC1-like domain-containing protein n=1 Tax=Hymenoscyphus fraxineus TaxID=746836 RepID=A0A9N9KT45_9HELO|nr:hypothetical protein HYFRA_00010163 [Hymenoscyphus fraxineus]